MKTRWTQNSVRLRITPDELAQLQRGEIVGANFLASRLDDWSVRVLPSDKTSLEMRGGDLQFFLAQSEVEKLSENGCEGVYFSQNAVRFYIEKDFPCVHPRAGKTEETPTETFAPPNGFEERKT